MMDKIDDALSESEDTHRFISYQEVENAQKGDVNMMKYIFSDWMNDEPRRKVFFAQINMQEPEKKYWLH